MLQDRQFEDFLDLLYAAPSQPCLWGDVLDSLVELVQADSAWMARLVDGGPGGVGITCRLDAAAQADYFSYYEHLDPFRDTLGQALGIFTDEDYLPRERLHCSEFYNDFMKPLDANSILKLRLANDGANSTVIHLNRGNARGAFELTLRGRAGALHTHLSRAARLGFKICEGEPEELGVEAALGASNDPTILLDGSGRVCAMNDAAGSMLSNRSPFSIERGYLLASTAALNLQLDRMLLAASDPRVANAAPSGTIVVDRRDGRLPLLVGYKPFAAVRSCNPSGVPTVVVTVRDPNCVKQPPAGLLMRLFGLTASEARIAADMVEGKSMADIARSAGVTVNTAKNHVKSIFAKTGVSRQSSLVGLLTRLSESM